MAKSKPLFQPELLDELMQNCKEPNDILGKGGLFKQLQKALLERILEGELTSELGYEKHKASGNNSGNSRNGSSKKTVKSEAGEIELDIPRDRNGDYSPKILPKNKRQLGELGELGDKIISLYARGMTTRDIQAQLQDLYEVEVSATLISDVTNEVLEEVQAWQCRPLDKLYPIVFLDALVIKVRQDKRVINKSFNLALGVNLEGEKELLGIWISENEGAKFWLHVLTEIKSRGVEDIFIACVDGLNGFPEAISAAYPDTEVQLCIVHMIRNSLRYVGWQNRKAVSSDLRQIYGASTKDEAELALTEFSEKWDASYPSISKSWLTHWENLTTYFSYPEKIRKAIYTTNSIESLNGSLRKVIKNKRVFPSDASALKQLYLGMKNISKKWTMPIKDWKETMNHFSIHFSDKMKKYE